MSKRKVSRADNNGLDARTLLVAAAASGKPPKEAVQYALSVWHECCKVFEQPEVPMPPRWPATGKDFMRLVVRGKTQTDSIKRLRDFFYETHAAELRFKGKLSEEDRVESERYAVGMVGKYRSDNFWITDSDNWRTVARAFLTWWRQKLSERRAQAAKAKKTA